VIFYISLQTLKYWTSVPVHDIQICVFFSARSSLMFSSSDSLLPTFFSSLPNIVSISHLLFMLELMLPMNVRQEKKSHKHIRFYRHFLNYLVKRKKSVPDSRQKQDLKNHTYALYWFIGTGSWWHREMFPWAKDEINLCWYLIYYITEDTGIPIMRKMTLSLPLALFTSLLKFLEFT